MTIAIGGKVRKRTWTFEGKRRSTWGWTINANGRQIRRQGFASSVEALEALDAYKAELKAPAIAASITLGTATERYLQAKSEKKSLADDARHLRAMGAVFGVDTFLGDLSAARISAWRDEQRSRQVPKLDGDGKRQLQSISAATINRPLAALRHLLQLACDEWEVLPKAPLIRLLPEPKGRVRYLTGEEQVRFLRSCGESKNPELAAIVTLLLQTGGRRNEVLGLTWERGIDLARGVVTFHGTKNGSSRSVPMTSGVYAALSGLPGTHQGRVFKTRSIRTAFERAVVKTGLDDFRTHDCRHTFASALVSRGATLQAVKELLGHKDLKMTLRYAHLSPAHLRDAVGLLEDRSTTAAQGSADEVRSLDGVSATR